MKRDDFLALFPNHAFRYIDQTGDNRPPKSSPIYEKDINKDGYEAYFTVAGFQGQGSNKIEDVTNVNTFFIDIDGRKDQAELDKISQMLPPTAIVETKNGYHIYWLLDEPTYKDDMSDLEWTTFLHSWRNAEERLVSYFNADKQVKDVTRILRVPNSYYWKKTGSLYKQPDALDKAFKVVLQHLDASKRYSLNDVNTFLDENSPETATTSTPSELKHIQVTAKATDEAKNAFFEKVEQLYPTTERPSFKRIYSANEESLPPNYSRNKALLVLASLAKRAKVNANELYKHVLETGWHGMALERGGPNEIKVTIESAYKNGYTFGFRDELIAWNMNHEESEKLNEVYATLSKEKREVDKVRFSNYEFELLNRNPNLKKTREGAVLFNYINGVYVMLTNDEVNTMVMNAFHEDLLWGYKTKKCVADKIACLMPLIPIMVESTDTKYANMKNGLLNLETLELTPHTPDYVSLIQHPFDYNPVATCPTWLRALQGWTEGDEAEGKQAVLQEYAGYCITRSMKYAKALFLIGDGGNGKSTYADTIAMMIGDAGVSRISLEDLYKDFGLTGLIGKRLNIVEEISGNYFHSHRLKSMISGEEVTANMKYKEQFKFKQQAKFIFAVNQMPRVDDSSSGTERRILAVHFKNNFRKNPDVDLRFTEGKLAAELPGIFNWALEGLKRVEAKKDFTDTDERREIIQDYREENSSVEGFLVECVDYTEGVIMELADLYDVYRDFCSKDGRTSKSRVSFSKEMKMFATKSNKFQFMPRKHGKDTTKLEGVELNARWERNFVSTYNPKNLSF
jgi:P4 family phage/plasmid primase-like protien